VILLLVVLVVRRPKKAATGTGFLREMTGAVNLSELQGYAKSGAPAAKAAAPAAAAKRPPAGDKTVPMTKLPDASLTVDQSRDSSMVGQVIQILAVPFTIGRRDADMSFENDSGMSRAHARITYEGGSYSITDAGSTNHTYVDEREVPSGTQQPLYDGVKIRLGTATVLTFRSDGGGSGFDRDKTLPEGFSVR